MEKTNPRQRVIEILLKVLARPKTFTKKQLATHFDVDISQIKKDFEYMRAAGITIEQEKRPPYRYTILPQRGFRELEYLQYLSEAEQGKIRAALQKKFGEKDALYIGNKLATLYNFQQLGLRALRRPLLDCIDDLKAAQRAKKQVVLKDYRSNSSPIKDRNVEPFYVDVELNTLHAYDLDLGETRHFLLPRIKRVEITDNSWQFAQNLKPERTDVFRISENKQVRVHLKLKVQAFNYLAEHYHKALSDIHPASESGTWDFETACNINFYGITNVILANFEHIQIVYPQSLKSHIQQKANAILKQFQ